MRRLVLLSGGAHPKLGDAIANALGVEPGERLLERFPDGETHAEVRADVGNADVYLVQPMGKPVGEKLL